MKSKKNIGNYIFLRMLPAAYSYYHFLFETVVQDASQYYVPLRNVAFSSQKALFIYGLFQEYVAIMS